MRGTGRPGHRADSAFRTAAALAAPVMVLAVVALAGCGALARHETAQRTPPDPAHPWRPAADALPPAEPPSRGIEIPPRYLEAGRGLTLAEIVDLALRNNPETRASWAAARAAAADLGSEQGAWWPQLDLAANYSKSQNSFSQSFAVTQTTYTPSLTLNWILFDFGGRAGDVEEARQTLYQANWSHNAAIQDVVLRVEEAYYQYLQAKGARTADSQAVAEAETTLAAARDRQQAGLGTVADVLQARSNLAQATLALQTVAGRIRTIRGSLATAMGLPASIDYDIGSLPAAPPTRAAAEAATDLIRDARLQRPDLAAARATVLAARAHAGSVRAEGYPSLSLQGSLSRRYYDSPDRYSDNYLAGVFLTFPLFTGFSHAYDVVRAEAQAERAQRQYETLRSSVELDVWTAYYDLQTADQRLETARDFLDYASESHDVALERYRAGVGTILDLLAAQTTLAQARAQDVQARGDWFLAVARLAHATGRLGPGAPRTTVRRPAAAPAATAPDAPAQEDGR